MNTEEAFKYVIGQSDCHAKTGVSHTLISQYRRWLKDGNYRTKPSIEKMEDIIIAYGGYLKQDKIWEL